MNKALPILVLTALLSSCLSVPAERNQSSPSAVLQKQEAHQLFSHTVRLRVPIKGSPGSEVSGSATVVSKLETPEGWEYIIITAAHVLRLGGLEAGLFVEVDKRDKYGWVLEKIRVDVSYRKIKRISEMYDSAVVKFLIPQKLPVVPADIASGINVEQTTPGDTIFAVGCSFGHPALVHKGVLTSKIRDQRAPISTWMVSSIVWDQGSSGGGIYNKNMELIGIISAEQGSGVGFWVPLTTYFVDKDGITTLYDVLLEMYSVDMGSITVEGKVPTKL